MRSDACLGRYFHADPPSRNFCARVCQLGALGKLLNKNVYACINPQEALNLAHPSIRPQRLHWMGQGPHSIDLLCSLGHQAVEAGLVHVACHWGTTRFDASLFNALNPHQYIWLPRIDGDEPPFQPLTVSSLLDIPLLEASARPVPLMYKRDLMSWWEQQLPTGHARAADASDLLTRPGSLVHGGCFHLTQSVSDVLEDTAALGACLSMIGTGAMGFICSQPCELCRFRLSVPGGLRCASCSRSKRSIEPHEQSAAAARASRARRVRAGAPGILDELSDDVRASFSRSIASSLWAIRTGSKVHIDWLRAVRHQLESAHLIDALLPDGFSDLSYLDQIRALQAALDQNEWDYAAWPLKISMAQSWLLSSTAVRSRRRGPGPLPDTLALAKAARDLLSNGHSKQDVAQALRVSPSHLSHLLRRTAAHLGHG